MIVAAIRYLEVQGAIGKVGCCAEHVLQVVFPLHRAAGEEELVRHARADLAEVLGVGRNKEPSIIHVAPVITASRFQPLQTAAQSTPNVL